MISSLLLIVSHGCGKPSNIGKQEENIVSHSRAEEKYWARTTIACEMM